jgi:glycogen debranching enzyme
MLDPSSRAATELIATAHARSIALLRRNLGPHGIVAATPGVQAAARRYDRVFARDAGLCALAMLESGVPELVDGAIAGIDAIAAAQADNGQMPKFVQPGEAEPGDFWYLGCIDASLWWLIAAGWVRRLFPTKVPAHWNAVTASTIVWLRCQEHPRFRLLQQNEASDWADIMPRSGYVLYTNALWYYVKRLHGLAHADETLRQANELLHPFEGRPDYARSRLLAHYVRRRAARSDLYLSFVNFASWGEEGDVFGNLLAVVLGLANDSRSESILHALGRAGVADPWPVRVVCDPIERTHTLWRDYMARHRQNLDWQYHNGGLWPMVGGFWVMALAAQGKRDEAHAALVRLAEANAVGDWRFNEWFHGRTLVPMGMDGQSWNAASFLLAERALDERVF